MIQQLSPHSLAIPLPSRHRIDWELASGVAQKALGDVAGAGNQREDLVAQEVEELTCIVHLARGCSAAVRAQANSISPTPRDASADRSQSQDEQRTTTQCMEV